MQLTPLCSLGTDGQLLPSFSDKDYTRSRLSRRRESKSPSYLYLRGSLYYFRYAFSDVERERVGRSEIRISLRTGYRREAQPLAAALYVEIRRLVRSNSLDYMEIRKRMNEMLCRLLEKDARNVAERETYDLSAHGIDPITSSDLAAGYSRMVKSAVNSPDFQKRYGLRILQDLIDSGIFTKEELTPDDLGLIINEYVKNQKTYHEVVKHRLKGDYSFEAPIFAERTANQQQASSQLAQPTKEPKPSLLLSAFIKKYIATKVTDGKWRPDSVPTHENRLNTLVEVLGDVDIHTIDRALMRDFREKLRKLPPNRQRSKQYKGKSIDEILAMEPKKVLSVKTVNVTIEAISSLFEFGIREEIVIKNPTRGLQLTDERQAIELRESFTDEDLQVIFSSPKYAGDKFVKAAYFWIPLIALYTGMRREEASQLHVSDVYQHEDGTWVFDINLNPNKAGELDKQLKNNKSCVRLIPIHNDLIEIGLLEYCRRTAKDGHERLFPELNKTEKSTKYGKQPGKQFCNLVKSLKLPISSKKVFHSLRHAFDDAYKLREGHITDVFKQVMAHEITDLAIKQYGSKFPPKQCYDEVISKIDYGLDLALLKRSKYARGGKTIN